MTGLWRRNASGASEVDAMVTAVKGSRRSREEVESWFVTDSKGKGTATSGEEMGDESSPVLPRGRR